jgi:peptide/nickel transport system substrate-binding protein
MNKIIPLLAVFFLISGCGDQEPKEPAVKRDKGIPAYGDAIIVAVPSDARNLVPILASDSASSNIVDFVFNALIKYNKDIEVVGDLAHSWTVSEDGLIITFFLRKGVKWHDGEPFTARDVLFTYQKLIDPRVATPYSSDFERIKRVEIPDDYTVRVIYKEPLSPALLSWGMPIMPKHLLEKEDLSNTPFSRHPVGTGPYKFKEWITGDRIILEANPAYFDGRPYIDRYICRIIPDQSTSFMELKAGGIDIKDLTPVQYTRQTNTPYFKGNFNKFRYPSFGYSYLAYNLLDPRFQDKRVRQAIGYAIDKKELIDGVLLGMGKIATGPFPPGSWACNPKVEARPYRPEKAKELFAQAGWQDTDGDGWLDKDGKTFAFTILIHQGSESIKKTAEIIQRRLREVGLEAEIRVVEWSTFLNEFVGKKRFETLLLSWSLPRDPDCYDIWHSSKTGEGEFNFISYQDEEVDRLLLKGRRTFDQEKRQKVYYRIHEILAEEEPYTFLFVPDALPIVHARFRGIVPAPAGIGYNFIRWYVPKEEQKYIQ